MKRLLRLFILLPLLLGSCQAAPPPLQTITIPDGKHTVIVNVTVNPPKPSLLGTLGSIVANLIPFLPL